MAGTPTAPIRELTIVSLDLIENEMKLIQILLPLRDEQHRPFPTDLYDHVASQLTDAFGGITSYMRTPAEGRWKPAGGTPQEDDIVVLEVMSERLDKEWWHRFRVLLERIFKQRSIVIRAQDTEQL
jgi:hypothetical protein